MNQLMRFFLFTILMQASIQADEDAQAKKTAVISCAEDCGMFRTMASLVGFLHLYEMDLYYQGLVVDFAQKGLYYDPEFGDNWWTYYFEPLAIGQINEEDFVETVNGPREKDCAMLTEFHLYKKRVYNLLCKYVKLKPHIEKKVNEFIKSHFNGFPTIGVHYRGTDKSIEAPRSEYDLICGYIQDITQTFISWNADLAPEQVLIFIATDEKAFLEHMIAFYGQRVIFLEDVLRSDSLNPVHKIAGSGYKKGEEALLDCLLLSRCHWLIKTSSNLSLFSTYFNPVMPVTHVTGRHWREPLE